MESTQHVILSQEFSQAWQAGDPRLSSKLCFESNFIQRNEKCSSTLVLGNRKAWSSAEKEVLRVVIRMTSLFSFFFVSLFFL